MRNLFFILLLLLLIGVIFIFFFFTPSVPVPSDPEGDWGDAPDPDPGMDTGYYAPFPMPGSPLVMVYGNAGIPAQFPTDNAGPQGPYTIDVDDFWIGPMFVPPFLIFPGFGLVPPVAPAAGDIPSVEAGVYDPADPDTISNLETLPPSSTLNVAEKADCDREHAAHTPQNPTGLLNRICNPVPPFSIPMNGWLVILAGNPPLAVFISRIWFTGPAGEEGGVYWNVLFDTDQSGEWSSGPGHLEWVVQNQLVPAIPPHRLVVSPAFEWGMSGNPFGRLLFPVWARNMVTEQPVQANVADYHGEGPAGGFAQGEVEDYFVEWRPIGQILPGDPGGGPGGTLSMTRESGDAAREGLAEDLATLEGPDSIAAGEIAVYAPTGPGLQGVAVLCLPGGSGIVGNAVDLASDGTEAAVCADESTAIYASWSEGGVSVSVEAAEPGSALLLVASRGRESELGTGQVAVSGGRLISVR